MSGAARASDALGPASQLERQSRIGGQSRQDHAKNAFFRSGPACRTHAIDQSTGRLAGLDAEQTDDVLSLFRIFCFKSFLKNASLREEVLYYLL